MDKSPSTPDTGTEQTQTETPSSKPSVGLASSDAEDTPKKKPGRPKGSKNKKKATAKATPPPEPFPSPPTPTKVSTAPPTNLSPLRSAINEATGGRLLQLRNSLTRVEALIGKSNDRQVVQQAVNGLRWWYGHPNPQAVFRPREKYARVLRETLLDDKGRLRDHYFDRFILLTESLGFSSSPQLVSYLLIRMAGDVIWQSKEIQPILDRLNTQLSK